jgi:hypothetical protein
MKKTTSVVLFFNCPPVRQQNQGLNSGTGSTAESRFKFWHSNTWLASSDPLLVTIANKLIGIKRIVILDVAHRLGDSGHVNLNEPVQKRRFLLHNIVNCSAQWHGVGVDAFRVFQHVSTNVLRERMLLLCLLILLICLTCLLLLLLLLCITRCFGGGRCLWLRWSTTLLCRRRCEKH